MMPRRPGEIEPEAAAIAARGGARSNRAMRCLIPVLMTAAALATTRAQAQHAAPEPPRAKSPRLTHEQFTDWNDFSTMGRAALTKRDLKYAEYLFKRAAEVARVESDTDPRLLARSYGDIAWVLHGQGRDEEAEPLAEWALIVRERYFGADSMQAGQTAYTLGMIEVDRGKLDEAQVHLERSLAACEKGMGPNHPFTADALDDLATLLVLRRSYDRARPLFERALKVFRGINPDHVGQYVPLDGLATIALNQGRFAEAEAPLDEAIKSLERDRYANPTYHAAVLMRKGDVLRKTNRADEAAKVEAKAKEVASRTPPTQPMNPRTDVSSANGWPGTPASRAGAGGGGAGGGGGTNRQRPAGRPN
jgi:tetratricopeptide (TPR) repeat protein